MASKTAKSRTPQALAQTAAAKLTASTAPAPERIATNPLATDTAVDLAIKAQAWDDARAEFDDAMIGVENAEADFAGLAEISEEAGNEAQIWLGDALARLTIASLAIDALQAPEVAAPATAAPQSETVSSPTSGDALAYASAAVEASKGEDQDEPVVVGVDPGQEEPAPAIEELASIEGLDAFADAGHHETIEQIDADLFTITVIGPAKGRRRAGYHFDATPQTLTVSNAVKLAIEADPQIAVTQGSPAISVSGFVGKLPIEAYLDADGEPLPVKVLGPAKGRRRAGHDFGAEVRTIHPTREQLDLLLGDEQLSVAPAEIRAASTSIPRQFVTVVSSIENHSAAGKVFGSKPVSFPLDELTEDQYRELGKDQALYFRADYRPG